MHCKSVSGKVSQLASFQTFTGNPNKIGDMLNMYLAVTKEDVWRVQYLYQRQRLRDRECAFKGQENGAAKPDNHTIDSSHYQAPDYGYKGLVYQKEKIISTGPLCRRRS